MKEWEFSIQCDVYLQTIDLAGDEFKVHADYFIEEFSNIEVWSRHGM